MMRTTLIFVAVAIFICANMVESEANPLSCQDNTKQCSTNDNCCTGCCQHGKCTRRDACVRNPLDPCAFHQCSSGKECYLQQVQCVTAPCNPVPACRNRDSDYE